MDLARPLVHVYHALEPTPQFFLTAQSTWTAWLSGYLGLLAPEKTNLFRPCFFKRYSISQALFSAGFVVSLGFACWHHAGLCSFWPLALVQQAQAAIFFVVLRSLGGAVLFRSSCPSPNSGYRFWLLALTFRSSRPAYGGRLTSPVSTC